MPTDVLLDAPAGEGQTLAGKLRLRRQNLLAFGRLFLVFCLLAGSAAFWAGERWTAYLQLACFLLLGYLQALMLSQSLSLLNDQERWLWSSALAAVVLATQVLFCVFAPRYALTEALVNTCAFLVPVAVHEVWRQFAGLSAGDPLPWYPAKDAAQQKSTTFLNSMPVRFRVQMDPYETGTRLMAFRAPVRMKLGLIFYHMLQEGAPDTASEAEQGWVFFTTGFLGGTRYLNPEAGLLENGIKENGVVNVRRL